MKKIMITACTVAVAAVTQASSIMWGGDIGEANQAALAGGSYAYLLWSESAVADATKITMNNSSDFKDWTVDNGAKVVAAYDLSGDVGNWTFQSSYGSATEAVPGYYSIVVVDGSAAADGLKGSYNFAGVDTNTDPMSSNIPNLYVGSGAWDDGNPDWIGANGFTAVEFTNVPEPTSGLLLLLGVAGLALRRRRA